MADVPPGEIWVTPAMGLHDDVMMTVVRMECSCGWEDKAFKRDAVGKVHTHNQTKHNGKKEVKGYGGITVG